MTKRPPIAPARPDLPGKDGLRAARLFLAGLGWAGIGGAMMGGVAAQPARGPEAACAGLAARVSLPGVEIEAAKVNEPVAGAPRHCEITGAIDRRTGKDGQRYAIRFRLRAAGGGLERALPVQRRRRIERRGGRRSSCERYLAHSTGRWLRSTDAGFRARQRHQ
ncbi:hypothetical protein [Roseomonas chloroacetimidivorans]|uniref:hypothetical protein n=1 Tax=Roseomonas chloroacetimidivorans TaxID=1766656 RepID=UPI003C7208F1